MSDYNIPLEGAIYAKSDGVKAQVANQIADYGGAAGLTVTNEVVEWRGQSLYVQERQLIGIGASFNFATVLIKPRTFGTLFGITATQGSTLESSWSTASIWELNENLATLPALEFLIDVKKSSDSDRIEFWLAAGHVAGDFPMNFTPREWAVHDISVVGFSDANNKILRVYKEI